MNIILPALLALPAVTAHYQLTYPSWRGDSFEEPASQWLWPCANVNQTISAANRTAWPLAGGAIAMEVTHDWAFTYINIALGNAVEKFNQSLVPVFNQTGEGTFCLPSAGGNVLAEIGAAEGVNATLQVIQLSMTGNALYNCADITLSANADSPGPDTCFNSTGVGAVAIANVGEDGAPLCDADVDDDDDDDDADDADDSVDVDAAGADADSTETAEGAQFTGAAAGRTDMAASKVVCAVVVAVVGVAAGMY